jgi:hypothetical protein
MTDGELNVGDEAISVAGNGASAAYGAWRLNAKWMAAPGQRRLAAHAIARERAYSPIP